MYIDTATIFNLYSDETGDYWYSTLLENCEFQITKGTNARVTGFENADAVSLHVTADCTVKTFLKPKEWLASTDKADNYTFGKKDFFIKGDYTEIVIDDADYTKGLYETLKQQLDDVYNVTTVDYFTLIPHIEVGGR
jgi:hypothetical protein